LLCGNGFEGPYVHAARAGLDWFIGYVVARGEQDDVLVQHADDLPVIAGVGLESMTISKVAPDCASMGWAGSVTVFVLEAGCSGSALGFRVVQLRVRTISNARVNIFFMSASKLG